MKLTSLKRKPKRKLRKNMVEPATMADEPMFPRGLELHLEDETLKKLGVDITNSKSGDTVHFVAKAKITSINSSDNLSGGKTNSMSVQVTDMSWGKKP